jgi:hypothetical protein
MDALCCRRSLNSDNKKATFFASGYSKRFSSRTAKGCVNFDSGSIAIKLVIRNFVVANKL